MGCPGSFRLALLAALASACASSNTGFAQQVRGVSAIVELNRGPVHESFAQPTEVVRETMVIPKPPPEPIQELPPERPEGVEAIWIPGYWASADDEHGYVWVSGVWRVPPAQRYWVPGYWNQAEAGFQWVPGFWASLTERTVQYLPEPPASMDQGPTTRQPGPDFFWVPGQWAWSGDRYLWEPGQWAQAQPDHVWIPATYYWSPTGYAFVTGFWDYSLTDRGVCFAPVQFAEAVYTQPQFVYVPRAVVDVRAMIFSFFVRPTYAHYYFGDYYGPEYVERGIVPWFSERFHDRHYYDPIFTYYRWRHRENPRWHQALVSWNRLLADRAELRPPHRIAQVDQYVERIRRDANIRQMIQQSNVNVEVNNIINQVAISRPIEEFRQSRDAYVRLTPVPEQQRQQLQEEVRELRRFGNQRKQLEKQAVGKGEERGRGPRTLELPEPPAQAERMARARRLGVGRDGQRTAEGRPGFAPRDTVPGRAEAARGNEAETGHPGAMPRSAARQPLPDTAPGEPSAMPGRPGMRPGGERETRDRGETSPDRSEATPRSDLREGRPDMTPGATETTPGRKEAVPGRGAETPGRKTETPGRKEAVPGREAETPGRKTETPGRAGAPAGREGLFPDRAGAAPSRPGTAPGSDVRTPQPNSTPGRFGTTPSQAEPRPGQAGAARGRADDTPGRFGTGPSSDLRPSPPGMVPGRLGTSPGSPDTAPRGPGFGRNENLTPGSSGTRREPSSGGAIFPDADSRPGQIGGRGDSGLPETFRRPGLDRPGPSSMPTREGTGALGPERPGSGRAFSPQGGPNRPGLQRPGRLESDRPERKVPSRPEPRTSARPIQPDDVRPGSGGAGLKSRSGRPAPGIGGSVSEGAPPRTKDESPGSRARGNTRRSQGETSSPASDARENRGNARGDKPGGRGRD